MQPQDAGGFYEDFGRRVRDARDAAGLTQAGLGAVLGLTRSSIANIEAGRQRVLLHLSIEIADATGVDIARLLPAAGAAGAAPASGATSPIAAHLRRLNSPDRQDVEKLLRSSLGSVGSAR